MASHDRVIEGKPGEVVFQELETDRPVGGVMTATALR